MKERRPPRGGLTLATGRRAQGNSPAARGRGAAEALVLRRVLAPVLLVTAFLCLACNGSLIDLTGGSRGGGASEPPLVVFITSSPPEALAPEEAAAWAWLQGSAEFTVRQLQMIDLADTQLPRNAVIWWHHAAEAALPSVSVRPEVLSRIANHLRAGGSAFLSLIAASYVVPLGVETAPPDLVSTQATFVGNGAELGGLQSRGGHPVLDRFWGGVVSAADIDYTGRPAVAYTGDRWPENGSVWAVHQNEHGVDPSLKIGVEYRSAYASGGTVLTLGAHCYFDDDSNANRPQLERLVTDALGYLGRLAPPEPPGLGIVVPVAGGARPPVVDGERHYWEPFPKTFTAMDVTASRLPPEADPGTALNRVQGSRSGIELKRYDDDAPFTLAVPHALVRGSQLGRIEEFRVHPVSLLSELRFGIVRPGRGVTWLDEGAGAREFAARPEGDELYYNDGELEISVYLTVDRRYPALVGLFAVRSPAAVELIATWRAQPGQPSASAPGATQPRIGWDEGAQAIVWESASGAVAKAGFGRETALHIIGFDPELHLDDGGLVPPRAGAAATIASPTDTNAVDSTAALAPDAVGGAEDASEQESEPTSEMSRDEAATEVSGPSLSATDLGRVALQIRVGAGVPAVVPLVAVGGPRDAVDLDAAFAELIAAPGRVWVDNALYYREFLGDGTMGLLAPETQFQELFKWSKTGIESLRLTYPGLGTAIASGYGPDAAAGSWPTAANALGGSGALWASMAADAYGDRQLAAATLELMAAYQGIDGRIPESIAAGWRIVENGVGTTPLFLVALDNHVRTWGDLELLESLWPAVERALQYLMAADADADGLIDGGSRLDRFSEDHAVRTTIHLAALWGAALEASERLAAARGGPAEPATTEALAHVRATLNDSFWNPNDRHFNFAKRADGSFVGISTVLPALPMLFGLLDAGIANAALDSLSSSELSRDWGVSLVGTPLASTEVAAEPGAALPAAQVATTPLVGRPSRAADLVSPVYTGWAALAEYASQRPAAGFAHLATNLLLLQHGNVGYAADGFATDSFVLHGDMPHSAASQAMTVLPIVWGMLGIRPDAVNRRVSISPQLPAGWNRINVDQVRVGSSEFRLRIYNTDSQTRFIIDRWRGDRDLELELSAYTPVEVDVALDADTVGVELLSQSTLEEGAYRVATAVVRPAAGIDHGVVSFSHDSFPTLISPPVTLRPGEASGNLRVVRTSYLGGAMRIELEGMPGTTYTLRLATQWSISRVTGVPDAVIAHPEPGIATIEVTIPGSGSRYRPIDLEVSFTR